MWCSHEENINFIPIEKRAPKQFISQPIEQLSLNGGVLGFFPSLKEAEKQTGCSYKHIGDVCKGKRQAALNGVILKVQRLIATSVAEQKALIVKI